MTRRQILIREVNERVLEVSAQESPELRTIDFLCECGSNNCTEVVALTNDEYRAVRSSRARFVVRPGHETPGAESVVFRGEHFNTVDKTARLDLALLADPGILRARPGTASP